MEKILNINLLNEYILKYNIENILDEKILAHAELHFYKKDESILKAGEKLNYYYLLVDGKIKISYLFENGKSMLLKFYKGLNTLGDIELLKNKPVLCDVDATSDSHLIAIPSNILRENYLDNIKFLHHLINALSDKLYGTINNSSYNFIYPLINRLSSYLVEHIEDSDYIILNSSFQQIAEFLGTTYRHLNRIFKELELKCIIKCDDKKIYILDEEKLRDLSKNFYVKSL